jgi:hypothetical protein
MLQEVLMETKLCECRTSGIHQNWNSDGSELGFKLKLREHKITERFVIVRCDTVQSDMHLQTFRRINLCTYGRKTSQLTSGSFYTEDGVKALLRNV